MFTYIKKWLYSIYVKWVSDIENQLDSDTSRSISEEGVLELIRAINRE